MARPARYVTEQRVGGSVAVVRIGAAGGRRLIAVYGQPGGRVVDAKAQAEYVRATLDTLKGYES